MCCVDDFASSLHGLAFGGMEKKQVHLVNAAVMVVVGLFMRNDHVLSCDLRLNIEYSQSIGLFMNILTKSLLIT